MRSQRIVTLILFLSFGLVNQITSQKFRFGMEASPQMSWLSTNDSRITNKGINMGFGIAAKAEYDLNSLWKINSGIQLGINQGGTLLYKEGGNYFTLSELKIPALNQGPMPIPNESSIKFDFKTVTGSVSLKRIIKETDDSQWFMEIPVLSVIHIFNSRIKVFTEEKILTSDENILNDINQIQLAIGTSIGYQHRIGRHATWYSKIGIDRTLSDITKNTGFRSKNVYTGNPDTTADDIYQYYDENSRTSLQVLSIKIGLLF